MTDADTRYPDNTRRAAARLAPMPTRNDRQDDRTTNRPKRYSGARRYPHSIRFSDSEWAAIEQAAAGKGLSVSEFIRASLRALAGDQFFEPSPAALSPGHLALIEDTWRAVHLLATLATRQVSYRDIDDLIDAARNAMTETMNHGPDSTVPGEPPSASRAQRNVRAGPRPDAGPRRNLY